MENFLQIKGGVLEFSGSSWQSFAILLTLYSVQRRDAGSRRDLDGPPKAAAAAPASQPRLPVVGSSDATS